MFDFYMDNIWIWCIVAYFVGFIINKTVVKDKVKVKIEEQVFLEKVTSAINKMDGSQFEDFVGYVFRDLGKKVKETGKTRDGGKDLILFEPSGKVYIEIKRYASKNLVSSPAILKLIGSAVSDGVNKCLFLTTSGYTKDAIKTAEKSKVPIELMDLSSFLNMCKDCNRQKVLEYIAA